MKKILLTFLTMITLSVIAQPWSSNGVCDFTSGVQWNNGGSTPCACTWWSVSGLDTILNCAFGNCSQADLNECAFDCNGHNGNPTDMVPRTCDATAIPFCWFQGAGNTAGFDYCNGLALPIELLEFGGSAKENYNELYWTTATELDNDYFIISYSTDGLTFESLVRVGGAGTTEMPQHYTFKHIKPIIGVSYYKLEQVDYNGESEEFPIISINNHIINSQHLFTNIYPNPSSDIFYFNYNGKTFNKPIVVKIKNVVGTTLVDGVIESYNSSQAIPFKLMDISKGHYIIEISLGSHTEVKKIMVK